MNRYRNDLKRILRDYRGFNKGTIKKMEKLGFQIDLSSKKHVKITHPKAKGIVFTSRTPSDHHEGLNLVTHLCAMEQIVA